MYCKIADKNVTFFRYTCFVVNLLLSKPSVSEEAAHSVRLRLRNEDVVIQRKKLKEEN